MTISTLASASGTAVDSAGGGLTIPSEAVVGTRLIVAVVHELTTSQAGAVDSLGSGSSFGAVVLEQAVTDHRLYLFDKFAASGDAGGTLSWEFFAAGGHRVVLLVIGEPEPTGALDVNGYSDSGATSHKLPDVSVINDDSLAVGIWSVDSSSPQADQWTGVSAGWDIVYEQTNTATTGPGRLAVLAAEQYQVSSGALTGPTATNQATDSQEGGGFFIIIPGASTAGPPAGPVDADYSNFPKPILRR